MFMRYIRIQVQQMTKGMADIMTANPNFFTIERVRRIPIVNDALGLTVVARGLGYLLDSRRAVGIINQVDNRRSWGKWRPGIEEEGSDSGVKSVFLGPDSDTKQLGAILRKRLARKEAGTNEQNSKPSDLRVPVETDNCNDRTVLLRSVRQRTVRSYM